jgi:hypothetical protein
MATQKSKAKETEKTTRPHFGYQPSIPSLLFCCSFCSKYFCFHLSTARKSMPVPPPEPRAFASRARSQQNNQGVAAGSSMRMVFKAKRN